jgi:hypothetical protein
MPQLFFLGLIVVTLAAVAACMAGGKADGRMTR